MKYRYSDHAKVVAAERGISGDLVDDCLGSPDFTDDREDGTRHYCKRFDRMAGRWLRVVVDAKKDPPLVVTVFFDRRLRRSHDDQGRQ